MIRSHVQTGSGFGRICKLRECLLILNVTLPGPGDETSVSASVLILLGIGNLIILVFLIQRIRKLLKQTEVPPAGEAASGDSKGELDFEVGGGILVRVFRRAFKIVDRPWKMYPLGILFGLGFDTSSEIALLGIASLQGAQGTSLWLIMIFPILFTGEFSDPFHK